MRNTIWIAGAIAFCVASGADSRTRLSLSDLAGEYVYPHEIDVQVQAGEHETQKVEDVLRIVKLAGNRAYVTFEMSFVNGHSCEFEGMLDYRNGVLRYRGRGNIYGYETDDSDPVCRLTLAPEGGNLVIETGTAYAACRAYFCSGRGHLDGQHFPMASRRPIKDVDALLESDGFKAAQTEYDRQ